MSSVWHRVLRSISSATAVPCAFCPPDRRPRADSGAATPQAAWPQLCSQTARMSPGDEAALVVGRLRASLALDEVTPVRILAAAHIKAVHPIAFADCFAAPRPRSRAERPCSRATPNSWTATSAAACAIFVPFVLEPRRHSASTRSGLPTKQARAVIKQHMFSTGFSAAPTRPLITFLSDYGHDDEFVGVCHGVIAKICPEARGDRPHARDPAPRRPGRRARAAERAAVPAGRRPPRGRRPRRRRRAAGGRAADSPTIALLVGPDNGLLSLAAERRRRRRRGGRHRPLAIPARAGVGDLPRPRHLRAGGGAIWPRASSSPRSGSRAIRPRSSRWSCRARGSRTARWSHRVVYVDRFGNVQLGVDARPRSPAAG